MGQLTMNYYKEVDVVKGITILLVILGHSFCTHPINLDEQLPILAQIIRSFQMPLFFVASGFLFSTNGGFSTLIKKKASRLLVPYLAFGILSVSLRYFFSAFTRGGTISLIDSFVKLLNGEFYWFLYTLLLVMIIVQLVNRKVLLYFICGLCVILCLCTDIRSVNIMTFGKVVYYLPFFALGIMVKSYYALLRAFFESHKTFTFAGFTVLFALSFLISGGGIGGLFNLYITPLLGIVMAWMVSIELANDTSKLISMFIHFGHFSLQYYLNHLLVMLPLYYMASKLSNFHPLVPLFSIFICAVGISFVMLKVERKMKITRFLCALK